MSDRRRLGRTQANIMYDYLAALPPGEGASMTELMALIDSSEDRVRQLLTQIRKGVVNEEGRYQKRHPALNIHFHRPTATYYNMSSL